LNFDWKRGKLSSLHHSQNLLLESLFLRLKE
jgi:hypothetical protein